MRDRLQWPRALGCNRSAARPKTEGADALYLRYEEELRDPKLAVGSIKETTVDSGELSLPDKKTRKPGAYITLSTREAIAELAQMDVLEVHPWGSCNENLEQPDRIIFDLDPDSAISWQTLASTATEIRKHLKSLNLVSFLKTTGASWFPFSQTLNGRISRNSHTSLYWQWSKRIRVCI